MAVFFAFQGERYGIACDRFTSVIDNMVAIARHVEATETTERLGVAGVADLLQAFRVPPDPARLGTWRDILGDLHTSDQVKAAFRRLSAKLHPDKSTGSHEAMSELSRLRDEALVELAAGNADRRATTLTGAETFVFEDPKDFGAMRAAEQFLEARGFAFGVNERGAPRGVMLGAHRIARWRDLTEREREELDGKMTGDMRRGPVTVALSATALARAARQKPIQPTPSKTGSTATKGRR